MVKLSQIKIGSKIILIYFFCLSIFASADAQTTLNHFDKNYVNETGLNIREIQNPIKKVSSTPQNTFKKLKTKKNLNLKYGRFRKNVLGNESKPDLLEDQRIEY